MKISLEINERLYQFDAANPLDIAIALDFYGAQPNAFDVRPATATACRSGSLIGDTRQGGSCNFEEYTFIPHCNGTHTECVGHITEERIFVTDCLKDSLIGATVVSILPENIAQTDETYVVELNEQDQLITEKALRNCLRNIDDNFLGALIVRTLPNSVSKKTRRYMETQPPFFTTEAMNYMAEKRIRHLLADVPSIDRTFDKGKLSNHRIFWNIAPESLTISEMSRVNNTITEMIYVPDEISDGAYLLNLQIAPFAADASPSRPLLFKIVD